MTKSNKDGKGMTVSKIVCLDLDKLEKAIMREEYLINQELAVGVSEDILEISVEQFKDILDSLSVPLPDRKTVEKAVISPRDVQKKREENLVIFGYNFLRSEIVRAVEDR